ncbi:MAG: diaminopropionate ammonia-lyase [Gammaproteobacteria bacterium]
MKNTAPPPEIRHAANATAADGEYPRALHSALSPRDGDSAFAEISRWPRYAPTPLRALPEMARRAKICDVLYKDESRRFPPVRSFKALGGAFAVYQLLAETVREKIGRAPASAELVSGAHSEHVRKITVAAATDGNHGRAVAWGAQMFGCGCRIFIHAGVDEERKLAMESLGARVIRIRGDYDESVRFAAAESEKNGWTVVSDTSYAGYEDIPRRVMAGYCVMADEILRQTPFPFTHFFVQGGVGGLAAAMCMRLWCKLGARRPRVVVVEPAAADCLYQSALCGEARAVKIREETIMAGLSCGEPSPLAWKILREGAHDFMTIPDDVIPPLMRELADGEPPVEAGESAPAGLAGFLAAAADESLREKMHIKTDSRVLVIGGEGATAPKLYEKITGRAPAL